MTTALEYDRSRTPRPMVTLHHVALICGGIPMAIGVLVFFLFVFTRSGVFAMLGFLTILAGCAAAFVGTVCLGVYWFQARRATPEDAAVARRNAKRDAAILLVNFPLAILFSAAGLASLQYDSDRVTVKVVNEDTVSADRVTLSTGADTRHVGPLAPGGAAEVTIKFGPSGLTATLVRGGQSSPHAIFEHMDGDTVSSRDDLRLVVRDGAIVLRR